MKPVPDSCSTLSTVLLVRSVSYGSSLALHTARMSPAPARTSEWMASLDHLSTVHAQVMAPRIGRMGPVTTLSLPSPRR